MKPDQPTHVRMAPKPEAHQVEAHGLFSCRANDFEPNITYPCAE